LAAKLEGTLDRDGLPTLSRQLETVVDEIEQKLPQFDGNYAKINETKPDLSKAKRDQLFKELEAAVISKRAQRCTPILDELERYQLASEDAALYQEIKTLIAKFKFKQAKELLA
jgi:hypothetical protein